MTLKLKSLTVIIQWKTGARGLRAIIEKVMKRVMFEVPSMPEELCGQNCELY